MPWLPMYCSQADAELVLDMLSPDFAPIGADGPVRWRADTNNRPGPDTRTAFWHIASGPLPLWLGPVDPHIEDIPDPFKGWAVKWPGADLTQPYFGAGHPGIFWLNLRVTGKEEGSTCGLSSFEWIGNRYSIIGKGAAKATVNRWAKLRRQVGKVAQKVPRGGTKAQNPPEIWAFPDASSALETADVFPL